MNTMKYLTTEELAARWRMNPQSLRNWRLQGRGPKFVKVGKKALYAVTDVEAWERDNTKGSTVE